MLYLIVAPEVNACKVGISKSYRSMRRRWQNIKGGSAVDLYIKDLFPGYDDQIEKFIHQQFSDYHVSGGSEWFRGDTIVQMILEYISANREAWKAAGLITETVEEVNV